MILLKKIGFNIFYSVIALIVIFILHFLVTVLIGHYIFGAEKEIITSRFWLLYWIFLPAPILIFPAFTCIWSDLVNLNKFSFPNTITKGCANKTKIWITASLLGFSTYLIGRVIADLFFEYFKHMEATFISAAIGILIAEIFNIIKLSNRKISDLFIDVTLVKKLVMPIAYIIVLLIITSLAGVIGKSSVKALLSPSKEQTDEKLLEGFQESVKEINDRGSVMIDEHTRLDRSEIGPGIGITYFYTFPLLSSNDINVSQFQKMITSKVCSNKDMQPSLKHGATYKYVYHDANAQEVANFSISAKDCP